VSLIRPIIRACAVGALRNKTWAQERVYDSDMTPLAEAVLGKASKPYICVYTDNDDMMTVGGKAELYDPRLRRIQVSAEIGVASAVHDPAPTGPIVIKFAATDQGQEWACDLIESQALGALVGDPNSAWGDLFKRFIHKVHRMTRRRGGQAGTGIRYAARRVVFLCEPLLYDFVPGTRPSPTNPVWDFIRLCKSSPAVGQVDIGGLVENFLVSPTENAPDWRIAQAMLGLDTADARDGLVVTGSPLPFPNVEEPPLDRSDTNEYPPGLEKLTFDPEVVIEPMDAGNPYVG